MSGGSFERSVGVEEEEEEEWKAFLGTSALSNYNNKKDLGQRRVAFLSIDLAQ